jgi:hypothetical protein
MKFLIVMSLASALLAGVGRLWIGSGRGPDIAFTLYWVGLPFTYLLPCLLPATAASRRATPLRAVVAWLIIVLLFCTWLGMEIRLAISGPGIGPATTRWGALTDSLLFTSGVMGVCLVMGLAVRWADRLPDPAGLSKP